MKESSQALEAFNAYLALGPTRSLERLAEVYQRQTDPRPPTRQLSTLKDWSREHHWQDRIAEHDRQIAAAVAERAKAEQVAEVEKMRKARLGVAAELVVSGRNVIKDPEAKRTTDWALRAIALGFETQRKDMGEPDQKVEHDIARDSPLDELVRRISRLVGPTGDTDASGRV